MLLSIAQVQDVLLTMKMNGVLAPVNDGRIKEESDDKSPVGYADQRAAASVALESAPPPPAWSAAHQTQVPDAAASAKLAAQWQQIQADDDSDV